jgi:hypothetical protein
VRICLNRAFWPGTVRGSISWRLSECVNKGLSVEGSVRRRHFSCGPLTIKCAGVEHKSLHLESPANGI